MLEELQLPEDSHPMRQTSHETRSHSTGILRLPRHNARATVVAAALGIVAGSRTKRNAIGRRGSACDSLGAGIHPKATPVYRTRSNGRTSGNMTSLYDILAKCTVYCSLGRSEFRVNTL